MRQIYDDYQPEDFEVWRILYSRQRELLPGLACDAYIGCLTGLQPEMQADRVPDFTDLDRRLTESTGWTIEVVPGLIPVDRFFALLARKRFCSSTWLRSKAQLDYLEEPDMFHDIFGHVPLLMDPVYSEFMQSFGRLGVEYGKDPGVLAQLERLYWFTIEFGLMRENGELRIYGAGLLSSHGESKQIRGSDVQLVDFDLESVLERPFRKDVMQDTYFVIRSFDELHQALVEMERVYAAA